MAKKLIGELSIPEKYTVNQTIVNTSWDDIEGKPEFAAVAETGNYEDLNNKPEIPSIDGLATKEELNDKQDKLTAGNNITIVDNVISSTASGGGSGSVTGYAFTSGQVLTEDEVTNLKKAINDGLIPFTINNELVTGCYTHGIKTYCISAARGSTNPTIYQHQYAIILDTYQPKFSVASPVSNTLERKSIQWPLLQTEIQIGSYDWLIDYIKNPSGFYLTINNGIAYYMSKASNANYITIYTIGNTCDNQKGIDSYTIYFTDNTFSKLDKTKTYCNHSGDTFITSSNWQNYITTSGDSWIYSNEYDGNLYSAKEIVIFWYYNDKKYCNYYKLPENQYLGINYQNQNFSAGYVDISGTEGIWYYDGVQIQNSNMNIEYIIFKT